VQILCAQFDVRKVRTSKFTISAQLHRPSRLMRLFRLVYFAEIRPQALVQRRYCVRRRVAIRQRLRLSDLMVAGQCRGRAARGRNQRQRGCGSSDGGSSGRRGRKRRRCHRAGRRAAGVGVSAVPSQRRAARGRNLRRFRARRAGPGGARRRCGGGGGGEVVARSM
jgi:hypothetical protein